MPRTPAVEDGNLLQSMPTAMTETECFGGRWFAVQLALCGFAGRQDALPRTNQDLPIEQVHMARPSHGSVAWLIAQLGGGMVVIVIAIVWVMTPDDSGSTGLDEIDSAADKLFVVGWVAFAMLGAADRCLLLRVALGQTCRLTTLAIGRERREKLRLRISATARRLSVALWLPLVLGEAVRWSRGKTIEQQATVWWVLIAVFMVVLPCVTLGAAAILLWAEVITIEEHVSSTIDELLAEPESDRDVAKLLQSFAELRLSLDNCNREWTWVLFVQFLVCVSMLVWEIAALVFVGGHADVENSINFYATGLSTVAQVFWPLVASIGAVVRVNFVLEAVPARITTAFIFTLVSAIQRHSYQCNPSINFQCFTCRARRSVASSQMTIAALGWDFI